MQPGGFKLWVTMDSTDLYTAPYRGELGFARRGVHVQRHRVHLQAGVGHHHFSLHVIAVRQNTVKLMVDSQYGMSWRLFGPVGRVRGRLER